MRIHYWSSDVCSSDLLVILLYAQLELGERAGVGSFLYAAMLIAFVAGASRLAADLTKLGTPREWTGLSVHETATRIGGLVRLHGGRGKLATVSPVYALEGGLQVFPELAAGPRSEERRVGKGGVR